MTSVARDQIERAARVYHTNLDASRALGIAQRSFARLCKRYDVETPYARKRRNLAACRTAA